MMIFGKCQIKLGANKNENTTKEVEKLERGRGHQRKQRTKFTGHGDKN